MNFRIYLKFSAALMLAFPACEAPDRKNQRVQETVLKTEVDQLTEKLGRLDDELNRRISDLGKTQSVETTSPETTIDLSSGNHIFSVFRVELSSSEFQEIFAGGAVNELFERLKKDGKPRPPLVTTLSAHIDENAATDPFSTSARVEFTAERGLKFSYPIEYEVADPANEENVILTPSSWGEEKVGPAVNGYILKRDGERFLIDFHFTEATRLENESHPFPTLFENKTPGKIEMPVIHRGVIETRIVIRSGVPEFAGTIEVPPEKKGQTSTRLLAVFVQLDAAENP